MKIREILEKLIYKKCCPTVKKERFPLYEHAIDQAESEIKALFDEGEVQKIVELWKPTSMAKTEALKQWWDKK